jgi:hypothetical protein
LSQFVRGSSWAYWHIWAAAQTGPSIAICWFINDEKELMGDINDGFLWRITQNVLKKLVYSNGLILN